MKKWFILSLIFAYSLATQAQKNCISDQCTQNIIDKIPSLAGRMGVMSKDLNLDEKLKALQGVIFIPVVVHVLFHKDKEAEQNLSDSLIYAQIEQANKDFSMRNTDLDNVPLPFRAFVANIDIQFKLIRIERRMTPEVLFYCHKRESYKKYGKAADPIKFHNQGGLNGAASTQFLNIWIGNISGGTGNKALMGYGMPHTTIGTLDGVVLHYKAVGPTHRFEEIAGSQFYNGGRTLTHEIGHWLGLKHLWGNKPCGDDGISDTPTQKAENQGLPTFPKPTTCLITTRTLPLDTSEMFMNFMDYSDDRALVMFTHEQKKAMRSLFVEGGARASFVQLAFLNNLYTLDTSNRNDLQTPVLRKVEDLKNRVTKKVTGKTVIWTPAAGAKSYEFQYRNIATETWETISTETPYINLPSLRSGSIYEVTIKAILSDGSSTTNSDPYLFEFKS